MLHSQTFRFLSGLRKNNSKAWFDAHRSDYAAARANVEDFMQAVIDSLGAKDPSIAGQTAKDCLFRINRDIRFSSDKSPYKTNFGASVNRGGRKSRFAGYYIHLEPAASFSGGGLWMPMPPELARVRQEIDYTLPDLQKILNAASFRKYYPGLYAEKEVSLARVPKGYAMDNPAAAFLKLKSFFAMSPLDNDTLVSKQAVSETVKRLVAARPLVDYLNVAVDSEPS